jgi:hypothetical protein
MLKDAKSYVPE